MASSVSENLKVTLMQALNDPAAREELRAILDAVQAGRATPGEVVANSVLVVDANKDLNGTSKIRNLGLSGQLACPSGLHVTIGGSTLVHIDDAANTHQEEEGANAASVFLTTGTGGVGGTATATGGNGGGLTFICGNGGKGAGTSDGGNGGALLLVAGSGGAGGDAGTAGAGGDGGDGGDVMLAGGNGGNAGTGTATGLPGKPGAVRINNSRFHLAASQSLTGTGTATLVITPASGKTTLRSNIIRSTMTGGASLKLPPENEAAGLFLLVNNAATGTGDDLTVKNDAGATIDTLQEGQFGMFFCDGTDWKGMNQA